MNPEKGFQFIVWDSEQMLKSVNGNGLDEKNDGCPSYIFQSLIQNTAFKQRFMDRVQKQCYNNGALAPENAAKLYEDLIGQIDTAMYAESARWGDYRRDVQAWSPPSGGYKLFTVENDFISLYEWMMNTYFPQRRDAFVNSLKSKGWFPSTNAPDLKLNGESITKSEMEVDDVLTMSVNAGSIFYTLDGTDPLADNLGSSNATNIELFTEEDLKFAKVPTSDIGDEWKSSLSVSSSWQKVEGSPGGIGYEAGSGYDNYISYDVLSMMRSAESSNANSSCYVVIPFSVTNEQLSEIATLSLEMFYDDGFVAYLNGTEIGRSNAPNTVTWNSTATDNHEATSYEVFSINNGADLLKEGENLLAIHALNVNLTSSDFIVNARLNAETEASFSGLAENVKQYTGSIQLKSSVHIKARAYNNNTWSALTEKVLSNSSDYDGVKITEIHYHPKPIVNNTTDDYEFLELKNTGNVNVYLGNAYFSKGIDYTFPEDASIKPGEFLVLADNFNDFYSKYKFYPYDNYAGQLNNDGESIVLLSESGDTICKAKFNDGPDWPQSADGEGYSLVTVYANPNVDATLAADWTASAEN